MRSIDEAARSDEEVKEVQGVNNEEDMEELAGWVAVLKDVITIRVINTQKKQLEAEQLQLWHEGNNDESHTTRI